MFISVYTDYNNNELMYSDKTHTDLESAKYDLNYTITRLIYDKFNIQLTDEYLFINNPLNVKLNIIQTININGTELIFIKNGLTIDVYSKQLKKGYLYNNLKEEHVYKFCVIKVNKQNEQTESIPVFNNPSLLINVYGKCNANNKVTNKNEDTEQSENEESEDIEQSENEEIVENKQFITPECSGKFLQQKSDLFLQELKERLKSRMKIKMD